MRRGIVAVRKRYLFAAGAVVVVIGVSVGILVSRSALPGTVPAGPLHDAHEGVATGSGVDRSGIWTAVVEATFDGNKAAKVTSLKLLPVPGFPTPTLKETGYITEGGVGSERGRPDRNFIHEPLMHATIRPMDNRSPHMAGIMLVLHAGTQPGTYAIEGVQVEYTVGSTNYRSRLYTAVAGCVPPPHRLRCPDAVYDRIYDRMLKDSGD
ncbi:MAG TPA: hypothetical protein VHC49_25995 [Mycobacteriales bacterium]|nr:hypothetical protein [Mycobacteriales bacterium]